MIGFARFVLGILALPTCWGVARTLVEAVPLAAGPGDFWSAGTLALLAGIVVFSVAWAVLPHPVRTYVFGHELTHALWGVLFGARASDVRVSAKGGSVRLSKTNVFITLAPYFFPFYTFVVIVFALVTCVFVRPLPCLPLWMFLVGLTWAFHVLFTIETLMLRQPDVRLYGRVFSWTFIFLANVALVLLWLVAVTPLSFGDVGALLADDVPASYGWLVNGMRRLCGG